MNFLCENWIDEITPMITTRNELDHRDSPKAWTLISQKDVCQKSKPRNKIVGTSDIIQYKNVNNLTEIKMIGMNLVSLKRN